jgi:alpha-beta hydrolase superfamily lysophospholipase
MEMQEFELRKNDGMKFHLKFRMGTDTPKGLVILIHGLSDHGGRFTYVAEKLARAGYTFMAPDLRGNGKSGGKRGHFNSLEQVIDDLDFLLAYTKEKFPGLPVILYGQSMGGNLALRYGALRQNEISCIISSSPWIRLAKPPLPPVEFFGKVMGKITPALSIPNGINPYDLCHDTDICKKYANDPLIHGKITLSTFNIIQASGQWITDHASEFSIPLLLLHGSGDRITLFEASRQFALKNSANCTFKAWEALLHELHNENEKDIILDHILTWLRNINFSNS